MDGIVSNNGYPTPHLLKMDVDGMEPFVVEGAMETIKQHRPIILMELGKGGSNDVGADIQKMAQDLIDIGYGFVFPHGLVRDADKVYDFTPGGETHSINVFAVPEDAINMVLGASASAKNMFS